MKTNLPVTGVEQAFPRGKCLVSKTDLKGIITYANDAFVALSGYSREELIGRNHNVVRHPDVPPSAFEDLWRTVKSGRPWRGIVKNRAKNGDHYWVDAFVVPERRGEQIVGYMSVRSEPSRTQVVRAEDEYKRAAANPARPAGLMRRIGWPSIRARMIAAMFLVAALIVGGAVVGVSGIHAANQALGGVYRDKLGPATKLSRVMTLLADSRSQILLALQHNPANPLAHLHDHPLDRHIDATLENGRESNRLLEEVRKSTLTTAEAELLQAFLDARKRYSTEGSTPARKALRDGDYLAANEILLKRINPLFAEVSGKGDAVLKQMLAQAKDDYDTADARYHSVFLFAACGALVSLLLIFGGGVLLMRAIMTPLRQALKSFDHISQGNLADEIDISGDDEMGRLLGGLATMQVHLKVMLDEIALASERIETRCDQLTQEMTNVVSQSEAQRDHVQSAVSAVGQFSRSVVAVASSAEGAAQAAEKSQALVVESGDGMSRGMDATGKALAAVRESSATIGKLSQSIDRIGAVTRTIDEIADQTNLLALNAAIEAARAGESGRGFAVVADEVRKLAERTTASTAHIAATVTDIQAATSDTVNTMDLAVREVETGTGTMKDAVSGLDNIGTSSDEVTAMARRIADAAKEQATAGEQVAADMERISGLIEQNTSSARDAWEDTKALSRTAMTLKELVGRFDLTGGASPR